MAKQGGWKDISTNIQAGTIKDVKSPVGGLKRLYISIDQFNQTDDNDDDAATDSMTEAPTFVIRNAINIFLEVPYCDVKKEAAQN